MSAKPPAIEPLRVPPDAKQLRQTLGAFATGVTIVSCRNGGGDPVGLTVNSFNALSLAPPLVLWSLRLASPSLPAFETATHFAVNVLAESQVALSRRFAAAMPGKFEQGEWVAGTEGVPLLVGSAASFECERISQQDAGDHRLFIGRVLACHAHALPPLVFHRGHYHLLGEIL